MTHDISTVEELIEKMIDSDLPMVETISEHRHFFKLSDGKTIRTSIAKIAINNLIVIHCQDGLFPGFSQTYRLRYGVMITYGKRR
jgi:hypothetical protein